MPNTIYLYGEVGYEFTDKSFAEELEAYPVDQELTIAINSPGGDVFQAQAINSLIKSRGNMIARIDGYAVSAASYLPLSADRITISSGGMMMIHKPMLFAFGNADELIEMSKLLEKVEDSVLVPAYMAKTGLDKDKIKELLRAETWLSAEEALELKLVDSLSDTPAVINAIPEKFKFKNVPEVIKKAPPKASEKPEAPEPPKVIEAKDEPKEKAEDTVDNSLFEARLRLLELGELVS